MNVYVIEADNGHVKIGISRNPQNRLAQLQTATSLQLSLAHVEQTERASELEQATHTVLASKRLIGEWFNASVAEAVRTIKDCLATLPPRQRLSTKKERPDSIDIEEPVSTAPISNFQLSIEIDTTELEQATTAFFKAILKIGSDVLGHPDFVFKIDATIGAKPEDAERAKLIGTRIQDALNVAKAAANPVMIDGVTVQ